MQSQSHGSGPNDNISPLAEDFPEKKGFRLRDFPSKKLPPFGGPQKGVMVAII